MNSRRAFALSIAALLVSACATGPKMSEMASSIPPLKADEGRIFFYRSNSMLGAAIQPSVYLDGQVVGQSRPGGFFYVDAKPGPKVVSTSTEVEQKLSFTLERGQVRYVKTVIGMGILAGRVYPELVTEAEGAEEVRNMSYIGTAPAR